MLYDNDTIIKHKILIIIAISEVHKSSLKVRKIKMHNFHILL